MKTILNKRTTDKSTSSKVYFTSQITPDALMRIYESLGKKAEGRVAVKLSTGEPGGHHFLSATLIAPLVKEVKGTIVECNTAYGGKRDDTHSHRMVAENHGFTSIAEVDIMDADGEMRLPVKNGTVLGENIVGTHLSNYDFLVDLVHFKGHMMGGFGGAIKNLSIGVASSAGKLKIHNGGVEGKPIDMDAAQDPFLECMAEATGTVIDFFGDRVIHINIMNNLSVDCDCDSNPHAPEIPDIGILASLDPVALDQACVDLVYSCEKGDNKPLIERMESRHAVHILEHADEIGMGTRNYELISIDED
ncbi:MAG: DUF362 domain-containing protein [Clostridiales bacterium]|nr:DUF362 domain-containing protein [Clostridiales bacterium]